MNNAEKHKHWIDQMIEKHECFPYAEKYARTESLVCEDREIRLALPEWAQSLNSLILAF